MTITTTTTTTTPPAHFVVCIHVCIHNCCVFIECIHSCIHAVAGPVAGAVAATSDQKYPNSMKSRFVILLQKNGSKIASSSSKIFGDCFLVAEQVISVAETANSVAGRRDHLN